MIKIDFQVCNPFQRYFATVKVKILLLMIIQKIYLKNMDIIKKKLYHLFIQDQMVKIS